MDRPRPDPEALLAHEAFLRRIARPLVRDDAGVDDVVQDTWLTALKKQPREASRLRQWLGTVARNLALRARRADERRLRREQAAARPEGDDVVARVARHQRIVDAVLGLDEPYRTAVLLRFYDGLSSDEIGARSGVSGAAVRKRLAKALDLLRGKLDDLHDGNRRAWCTVLLPFLVTPRLKPAALLGGIVMGTKAKLAIAAVLLCALLGTLRSVARQPDAPARSEPVAALGVQEPAAVPPDPLPSPVDFALVDRDRDVFGVVVRRDGTPVAGADVQAVYFPWRRVLHGGHNRRFEERDGPRTRTAGDGTFSLRLERGDLVHARARAPGFATTDVPLVQAGERVRIVLAEPARLSVRVAGASGRPLAGARVAITLVDPTSGVECSRADAETGEDGRASWDQLPDDRRVSLHVRHRSHASAHRWVEVGERREIEIVLAPGFPVRGRVLDAVTLRAIPGAVVDTTDPGPKETRTDAEGRYTIDGLEPTVLAATAEGYAQAGVHVTRENPLAYYQYWPDRRVEAADEVDILLVRADVVTGRIVDPLGAPVAGAFLSFGSPAILSISGESDPDGRFRIEGPWSARSPSGRARGDATAAEIGDGWQHALSVFARGHGRARVTFDARMLDLGDIVLPPAGAIEGRVLTPEGETFVGAPVLLSHPMMERRRTDDLGRFRFRDVEAGTYGLGAHPEGTPGLERAVELPPGGRVVADLRFERLRPFAVWVRREDGEPVAGATCRVATGFRMSEAVTLRDGRATLQVLGTPKLANVEPPMLKGDLRYRRPPAADLEGTEQEIAFVLLMDGLVRGRVSTPDGAPLGMAQLVARDIDRQIANGVKAPDGTFELQVPRDTTFDLVLTGLTVDPRPAQEPFRLMRAELAGVRAGQRDLVLTARSVEATRTLRVRVLAPDGKPAVAAVAASPSARHEFVHTQDGVAELHGLPDEKVTVFTGSPPVWSWLRPEGLEVVPAGQEVTLRFREAVTIVGTVLLPDGSPAGLASILAYRGRKEIADATSDAQGRFGIALDPGSGGPIRLEARLDPRTDFEYRAVLDGIEPGATGVEITLLAVR